MVTPALDDYILIGWPPTKSDTPVPDIAFGGQDNQRMLLEAIENNRNTNQRKNGERKMQKNAYHDLKILPEYFAAVKNGTKPSNCARMIATIELMTCCC